MEQRETRTGGESVELKTLAIAAAAAVAAAVVTSTFWSKGALISTALTPVIVSLVKEGLNRHAAKVAQPAARVVTAPVKGVAALAGVGAGREGEQGTAPRNVQPPEQAQHAPPPTRPHLHANGWSAPTNGHAPDNGHQALTDGAGGSEAAAGYGPPASLSIYGRRRFRWKLALVTGLAAFAVAAAVLTLPELVFGGSVTGNSGGTTLFGGGERATQSEGGASEDATGSEAGTDGEVEDSSDPEAQAVAPEEEPVEPTEEPAPEEEPAPTEEPAPVEPEPSEPVEPQAVPSPSE